MPNQKNYDQPHIGPVEGRCPKCGANGYRTVIGGARYGICHLDRTRWLISNSPLSPPLDETLETRERNARDLADYELVQGIHDDDNLSFMDQLLARIERAKRSPQRPPTDEALARDRKKRSKNFT